MKKHKRSATGHSQWNCSFSCGTAVNNYKWVIQPTSADSALLPDFKSFAPRRHLHHSLLQPAALRMHGQCCQGKGGGRGKEWKFTQKVQERARGIFLCLSRRSNCDVRACGAPCMGLGRIAVGSAPRAGGTLWRSGWGGAGRAPGHGQLHGGAAVPLLVPLPALQPCLWSCGGVLPFCNASPQGLPVLHTSACWLSVRDGDGDSWAGMQEGSCSCACGYSTAPLLCSTPAWDLFSCCDSSQNLSTSIPSGLGVVPRAGQQDALFEAEMSVCCTVWLAFFFPFLKASQGALHECTRCRSCLFSPGCSFNLKEITCSFPIA